MAAPLDPMRQALDAARVQAQQQAGNDPAAARTPDGKSFGEVMKDFVNQADQAQHEFDAAIEAVENGSADNLHQVMLAQQQAQLSLKLAAEVRNKLVEAYREVMRTQF